MLIFIMNMKDISDTERHLISIFNMKDLGEVDNILAIKIKKHANSFVLNQSHYIEKLIDKLSHLSIKEAITPHDISIRIIVN